MDAEAFERPDDFVDVPAEINVLSRRVIGMAIEIHKSVGPGLPEEAYELAMKLDLKAAGIPYSRQHCVTVHYRGVAIARVRMDFLIDNRLVVELKSVDCVTINSSQPNEPLHRNSCFAARPYNQF